MTTSRYNTDEHSVSRRMFIQGLVATVPTLLMISPWHKAFAAYTDRSLSFRHLHTDEKLEATYFSKGQYIAEALRDIDYLLRDHRTGDVHLIDKNLLNILHQISSRTKSRGTFEVICGYRSPKTNTMLRKKSNGVAKKSLHMQGRAIDVRLTDVDTKRLCTNAISLRAGGVGYYRRSNFVHLDTGHFRTW